MATMHPKVLCSEPVNVEHSPGPQKRQKRQKRGLQLSSTMTGGSSKQQDTTHTSLPLITDQDRSRNESQKVRE